VIAVTVSVTVTNPVSAREATGLQIAHVDLHAYPRVRLTVLTPNKRSHPLTLEENGKVAAGLKIENMGRMQSLVLAFDRSRSMRGRPLMRAAKASRMLLNTKPNSYRVSFVVFASRSVQLTDFSTSTTDAAAALRSIAVDRRRGTGIYDTVRLASIALMHSGTAGRAIILVTDGREAISAETLDHAVTVARRARATVYVVTIGNGKFRPRPLQALAAKTGGRMLLDRGNDPLTEIYVRMRARLRNTWQMTYDTAVRPGSPIHLTVSLTDAESTTTTVTPPESASPPLRPPPSKPPLTVIALIAFAMVPVALAAVAAIRKFQRRNVWTGF
jgi:hypothetical protein